MVVVRRERFVVAYVGSGQQGCVDDQGQGGLFPQVAEEFGVDGSQGGQSEELLRQWRRSRGIGDEIVIATKLGARPFAPPRAGQSGHGQPAAACHERSAGRW